MKIIIFLFAITIITYSHRHTYKCAFEQNNQDLRKLAQDNIPEILENEPGVNLHGRVLTTPSTAARLSMRMHVDSLALASTTISAGLNGAATTTTTNLVFLIQALTVAKEFYQTRIKVGQLASITVPNYCVDFQPSNKGAMLANIDLLIIANYLTDKNLGYGATGKSCDYVTGAIPDYTLQVGRPTVGRIIFNTYNLVDRQTSLTNRLFQSITSTTLHEITHILGFDSTLYTSYLDPTTGSNYNYAITINGSSIIHASRPATTLLKSPFVLAWARNYYDCIDLEGMPLQNEDGSGSHWQRTAMYDQIMTGTSLGATKGFSGLTYALLKDSGWYTVDDTFAEKMNYGYKKGCSFVREACYSATSFPEFCNAATSANNSYCSTTFQGKAICSNTASLLADSCGLYGSYFNCVDQTSVDSGYQSYTRQVYAPNSYCLLSTLGTVTLPSNLLSRCYPFVCLTSSIVFTIGSYSITCLSNEAGVLKSLSALAGNLKCPIFQEFCTVARKSCTNWCKKNGFCTGGVCNCISGTSGIDCGQTVCTNPLHYYNPATATCILTCPTGTYQNIYSHTCESCQYPCNECINNPTNCVQCISTIAVPQFFYNSLCYSSCPSNTFVSGSQCFACDTSVHCDSCSTSATNCTSCLNGRYLSQPSFGSCITACGGSFSLLNTINSQCVASCPNNLIAVSLQCIYCGTGTYKQSGNCVSDCNSNCGNPCTAYFYPDQATKACLTCDTSCLACSGSFPENCTSCKSTSGNPFLLLSMCWSICPKGYYANPTTGKCELCPVGLFCIACSYNSATLAPICTSCKYTYYFQTSTSTCLSTCISSQYKNTWNNSCDSCEVSCQTCNGPSTSNCLSCPALIKYLVNGTGGYCLTSCPTVGYVPLVNNCQKCDVTCDTCNGISSNQCSLCKSGYFFSAGLCRYICPNGTYPDTTTSTCITCHSTCSYCFNSTASSCTFCATGLYLYNFTCSSTCPGTSTPNSYNICFENYQQIAMVLLIMILLITN